MSDDERAPNRNAAFLPIGITFLAVGLAMLFGPASASAWAFIPVGITFLVLWLSGRNQTDDDDTPRMPDPKKGDGSVPPASDTARGDSSDGGGSSGGDGGGGGGD